MRRTMPSNRGVGGVRATVPHLPERKPNFQ